LIVLLKDDMYAWSPSIWWPYVGKPVSSEAEIALFCIGKPAVPALEGIISSSSNTKLKERAAQVLARIRAGSWLVPATTPTTGPSP